MSQVRLLLVFFFFSFILSVAYLYLQKNTDEHTEDEKMIFEHWKKKYGKVYTSVEEEQNRLEVFLFYSLKNIIHKFLKGWRRRKGKK